MQDDLWKILGLLKKEIKKPEIRNRRLLKILEQEQPEDIHVEQLRLSIEKVV